MMEVTASIQVERPTSEAFTYLADIANNPKWQKGMQSCTWTSEPPLLLVGASVRKGYRRLEALLESEV